MMWFWSRQPPFCRCLAAGAALQLCGIATLSTVVFLAPVGMYGSQKWEYLTVNPLVRLLWSEWLTYRGKWITGGRNRSLVKCIVQNCSFVILHIHEINVKNRHTYRECFICVCLFFSLSQHKTDRSLNNASKPSHIVALWNIPNCSRWSIQ